MWTGQAPTGILGELAPSESLLMRFYGLFAAALTCISVIQPVWATDKSDQAKKPKNYAEAAEECERAIAQRMHKLANEYSSDVFGLKQRFQKDGDLERALAADAEWSRSLSRKPLNEADLVASPPELTKLQRKYMARFALVAETVAEEVLQDLTKEAAELAKAGKLADGRVLQQEIDTIKRLYLGGRDENPQATGKADGDVIATCEEAIRQRRLAIQPQYVGELEALEKALQAKGALEDLLAAKAERERFIKTPLITEENVVESPDALRDIQQKYRETQQNLSASVAEEFVARLEQQKQALTIEGRLEEAMKAKVDAELVRKTYPPVNALKKKGLIGKWEGFVGDAKVGVCEVLQDGQELIFVNEMGWRARGFQKDEFTVVAVGWGGLPGTVSPDTNVIRWHNGTSWRR